MFDIKKIINILNNKQDLNLFINKNLFKKQTARSLKKYILEDANGKKYLLEIAQNSIEIFYFKRTIEHQKKLSELKHNFKLNMPLYIQSGNKLSYAVYEYFENVSFVHSNKPIEILNTFYDENSIEIEVTSENIDKILSNFLSAWPSQFHSVIKRQKEFLDYKKELNKFDKLKVCYEHGDYATNNIFNFKNDFYLMDFEFSRDFQPIGFDIAYFNFYNRSKFSTVGYSEYKKLNHLKLYLDYSLNYMVDNNINDMTILNDIALKIKFGLIYKEELINEYYKRLFK